MNYKNQQGFLMIVAIFLIMVIGSLGVAVAYMIASGALQNNNLTQSEMAFNLANSGLEKATRFLATPLLTGANSRITCGSLIGNSDLTNSNFGDGEFTVTTLTGSPSYASSTLNGALTASAKFLTLANTTGFAETGRIIIDTERINYSAISGNNLIGLIRNTDNTIAAAHANGSSAAQYQCSLDSIVSVPNSISPLYQREQQQNVELTEGWAVGNRSGNNFIFGHWNYPTELAWTYQNITDSTNKDNLNGVSLLSNAEGWVVGNENRNNFTFLHLLAGAWDQSLLSGACSGQNLYGISAVSSKEAWAVGQVYRSTSCNSGNYRYTILYWNGSTWTKLSSATTPSIPADSNSSTIRTLNAVQVIATTSTGVGNVGFAVGLNGRILKYNGGNWTQDASPTTQNLTSIFVTSASEAWAVGAAGVILKWNGSSWSTVSSPTGTQLNSISMIDTNADGLANYGWAVGNSGVAIIYNGTNWSSQNIGGGVTYKGVAVPNSNEAWVVGASGNIYHWNSSAWSLIDTVGSAQLNAIAIISPVSHPTSGWHEVFP